MTRTTMKAPARTRKTVEQPPRSHKHVEHLVRSSHGFWLWVQLQPEADDIDFWNETIEVSVRSVIDRFEIDHPDAGRVVASLHMVGTGCVDESCAKPTLVVASASYIDELNKRLTAEVGETFADCKWGLVVHCEVSRLLLQQKYAAQIAYSWNPTSCTCRHFESDSDDEGETEEDTDESIRGDEYEEEGEDDEDEGDDEDYDNPGLQHDDDSGSETYDDEN